MRSKAFVAMGAAILLFGVQACRDTAGLSARERFDEVVTTLSIDKAITFLEEYPNGALAEELLVYLAEWCGDVAAESLCREAAVRVPADHPVYASLQRQLMNTPNEAGGRGRIPPVDPGVHR